jgi:hypothetical protein
MHSHRKWNASDMIFLASVGIRGCGGNCYVPQSKKAREFCQSDLCCPLKRQRTLQFLAVDRFGVAGMVNFLAAKSGIGTFNKIEANWTKAFQVALNVE